MANAKQLKQVRLNIPLNTADLQALEIGTAVYLDGLIMTGREGVYRRLVGERVEPPADLKQIANVNFHCSPAAARQPDGSITVGAVTATASFRFAQYLADWFELSGCRVIIGKGGMSAEHYRELFVPAGAVYLTTVGYGTGADELGIAQAMWLLRVENFGPLLVESDLAGNSLFEQQNREINARIEQAYRGLKKPALSRYGETDDKTRELI